jgi:hypothetical protein
MWAQTKKELFNYLISDDSDFGYITLKHTDRSHFHVSLISNPEYRSTKFFCHPSTIKYEKWSIFHNHWTQTLHFIVEDTKDHTVQKVLLPCIQSPLSGQGIFFLFTLNMKSPFTPISIPPSISFPLPLHYWKLLSERSLESYALPNVVGYYMICSPRS